MNKVFKLFTFAMFVSNIIFLQGFIVENKTGQTLRIFPYEPAQYVNSHNFWRKAIPLKSVEIMWLDKACDKQLPLSSDYYDNDSIIIEPGQYVEFFPADRNGFNVFVTVKLDLENIYCENRSEVDEYVSAEDTLTIGSLLKKTVNRKER